MPENRPPVSWRRRLRHGLYATTATLAAAVVGLPLSGAIARAVDPPTASVSGIVFEDANGDGVRQDTEPGVAGVRVSDGVDIVATGDDGRYSITLRTDRRAEDLVFITQPAGWAVGVDEFKTPRHYRLLGGLAANAVTTADFGLTRDPAATSDTFAFANIADPHINPQLPAQIEEINTTHEKLGFIAVSGDLTNNATDAEFERYKAATALSELPVWPAVGNHEYFGGGGSDYASRINNYRRHVGPEWYSFDYGNRHYLVLENNGQAPFEEQLAWVRKDLELGAAGKEVVVLAHMPMNVPFGSPSVYDAYGALLEQYGTELILVGHEHSNDVEPNS
ncbi:MAG: metallophosphoesterase, partial [Propionibacteriaceae bacterium]|nr:metallophosphoesterase [Propionibacteriaceae bacterium]